MVIFAGVVSNALAPFGDLTEKLYSSENFSRSPKDFPNIRKSLQKAARVLIGILNAAERAAKVSHSIRFFKSPLLSMAFAEFTPIRPHFFYLK